MNFYTMQLGQFILKLKGLIRKIGKSSVKQIQSHTQTCHEIIAELIKDDEMLKSFNSQKLRLLAYEVVLFLVEMMNTREQEARCRAFGKNKIEEFLGQIYETLAAIKQLIRNLDYDANNDTKRKVHNFSTQSNGFDRLDRNLNQYQQRLGNILTEFQQTNNKKTEQKQCRQRQQQVEEDNDFLIEQMHRIINRKEKRISQLTRLLQQVEQEKISIEISHKKTQNQMCQKNSQLLVKIEDLTHQKMKLIQAHQQQKKWMWMDREVQIRQKMKIQQIINQKIEGRSTQCDNLYLNNKIQTLTQQTISSAKIVRPKDSSLRKLSLEKVGSTKSFRRIGFGEDKDSLLSEKRFKEMAEKNQELYMFIYCQAATLEELL